MSQRYVIRPTVPEDSQALLDLLSDTPQEGSIQLNFERQPNYFYATYIGTSDPDLWVMEDTQEKIIVGAFSIGKRNVFINGVPQAVRYASDLRIHRSQQGGRALYRMFKHYKEQTKDEWMQTVILEENKASMDTVSSGRTVLPTYYPAGRYRTNMIDLRRTEKRKIKHYVRRATADDVVIMQAFFDKEARKKQFYPCYDFSLIGTDNDYYRDIRLSDFFLAFESNGDRQNLIGMTGLWDQKNFKQTRIAGYANGMQYIRPFYNFYTKIFGGLSLPPAGALTSYLYLHSTVIANNETETFADLVAFARRELKNTRYDALVFGFDVNDPLHAVADKYKKVELFSRHFLTSYGEDPASELDSDRIMYLETSRL